MIFRQKSLRDRNTTEPTYIGGTLQQAWCLFSWIIRIGFIEKKKLFIESAICLLRFIEISNVQEKARNLQQKSLINKMNLLLNMTQDEFFDRLKECFAEALFAPNPDEGVIAKKHYVYGLQGLCNLLGCSTATASRIKRSGVIDAAISQVGKIIVVDADLALDLIKTKKPHKKGYNK